MRHKALPPRRVFALRLLRNLVCVSGLIAASLALGAAGYHAFAGRPWLDDTLTETATDPWTP